MLTLDKIYHAAFVLKDVVRHTELVSAPKLNPECELYLKPENLQVTGSFKVRGAGYMMSQLTDEEKAKGVIACSAGNHAQGVALAAQKYGIKSVICLPFLYLFRIISGFDGSALVKVPCRAISSFSLGTKADKSAMAFSTLSLGKCAR